MGWDFTQGATRADIVAHLTRTETHDAKRWHCLAHSTSSNVLWSVLEFTDALADITERYIRCDLLGAEAGYGWGYKPLTESMGPYYYTCPLSYLEMAPVTNASWREKVYAYWQERKGKAQAAQANKPAIGQWVKVNAPWSKEWHGYTGRVTELARTKALVDRTVRIPFAYLVACERPAWLLA